MLILPIFDALAGFAPFAYGRTALSPGIICVAAMLYSRVRRGYDGSERCPKASRVWEVC